MTHTGTKMANKLPYLNKKDGHFLDKEIVKIKTKMPPIPTSTGKV